MRYLLGTFCSIEIHSPHRERALRNIEGGFRCLKEVESKLSRFRPDSDISRLNAAEAGERIDVHPDTFGLLQRSIRWTLNSHGAFNPLILPLVRLWESGERCQQSPDAQEIKKLITLTDPAMLTFHADGRISKRHEAVGIDLGAIGKGFAVDRAGAYLREQGVRQACVDTGGNLGLIGKPSGDSAWTIGVQHPLDDRAVVGAVELSDQSIATSGNYERGFRVGGRWFGHLLDPRTGYPVEQNLSVSVAAPDAETADMLASALSVLGPAEGESLLDQFPQADAFFVLSSSSDDHGLHFIEMGKSLNWRRVSHDRLSS